MAKTMLDGLREGLSLPLTARQDFVRLQVNGDGLDGHALTMHLPPGPGQGATGAVVVAPNASAAFSAARAPRTGAGGRGGRRGCRAPSATPPRPRRAAIARGAGAGGSRRESR